MRYTVWSRGREIGETDLGFIRIAAQSRSGSFHPNAEGERLMPVIASVLPAMRAYLDRDARDAQGKSMVQPALYGSTLFADLAEAFHHLQSLDLELRREDGSVVPTSDIGIQDTEQLIQHADLMADGEIDVANWDLEDDFLSATEFDPEIEAAISHDVELFEMSLEEQADDLSAEWTPDDVQAASFPRYQIHVLLLHENAIP